MAPPAASVPVLGMEWAGEVCRARTRRQGRQGRRQDHGAPVVQHLPNTHWPITAGCFRAPSNMNFQEAGPLPVALATMHNAVRHQRRVAAGASRADPGRSSGVRPDRRCKLRIQGRKTRDRFFDRCDRGGGALKGNSAPTSAPSNFQRSRLGRSGAQGNQWRRADLIVDQVSRQARKPESCGDQNQGPNRQCRPGRRHPRRFQFSTLHAARRIQFIRRHLSHHDHRGDPRDFLTRSQGYLARGGIAKAAIADRQVFDFADIGRGVSASHGSQQAPRQDRGDGW